MIGIDCTSGTYTGNAAVNRAIPHGLPNIPKFVLLNGITGYYFYTIIEAGKINWQKAQVTASSGQLAVTAMDDVNFYVGNATDYSGSANANTYAYHWVAVG